MPDLSLFDLFLTFVLVVGMPLWALRSWRRLQFQLGASSADARVEAYRRVIVVQWSLVAFLVVHMLLRELSPTDLMLDFPRSTRAWGTLLVAGALTMAVLASARGALQTREKRDDVRRQIESVRAMIPHTPREARWFRVVAWTAGICEEILYRGYLPWLIAHFVATPWAFAIATLVFGVGHAYQGKVGILKTTLVGAVMALLTYFGESVVPAIILHVGIDAINGNLAYRVLTQDDEAGGADRHPPLPESNDDDDQSR